MLKSKSAVLILLVVVALALGWAVYVKMPETKAPDITRDSQSPASRPRTAEEATASATKRPPWIANLPEADKALFNPPSAQASDEVKRKFSETLRKSAKSAGEITISKDCLPSPITMSVDNSLSFKVKNVDTVAHTIFVHQSSKNVVEPNATITITLDKKSSISYGCDSYIPVGFLVAPL